MSVRFLLFAGLTFLTAVRAAAGEGAGPQEDRAGEAGGRVIAEGPPAAILSSKDSLTGRYLSGDLVIDVPRLRHRPGPKRLVITGATRAAVEPQVQKLGLLAWATDSAPSVPMHAVSVPRIGYIHSWQSTQDEGWWRLAFDHLTACRAANLLLGHEQVPDRQCRTPSARWPVRSASPSAARSWPICTHPTSRR